MWGSLENVSQAMVKSLNIQRDIVDVGWPSAAAIAFGSPVGLWVIPIALLVNVILLALKVTKTLNIDLWNFWHFAFIGSLIAAATGNLTLGLAAAAVAAAVMLFFADWTAPAVQKFYNLAWHLHPPWNLYTGCAARHRAQLGAGPRSWRKEMGCRS
jgi:galactitol PTS system EIIC component